MIENPEVRSLMLDYLSGCHEGSQKRKRGEEWKERSERRRLALQQSPRGPILLIEMNTGQEKLLGQRVYCVTHCDSPQLPRKNSLGVGDFQGWRMDREGLGNDWDWGT